MDTFPFYFVCSHLYFVVVCHFESLLPLPETRPREVKEDDAFRVRIALFLTRLAVQLAECDHSPLLTESRIDPDLRAVGMVPSKRIGCTGLVAIWSNVCVNSTLLCKWKLSIVKSA
jgi:hypothetical protein